MQDINAFIDGGAGDGFILVSFGSVIDLTLAPNLARSILEALGSFKQSVIWAAKSRPVDQVIPKNVKFWDWIPQNDLLGLFYFLFSCHDSDCVPLHHDGIQRPLLDLKSAVK